MATISLSTIHERIEDCNKRFCKCQFILAHNALNTRQCYMVDLSLRAVENVISDCVVHFLTCGISCWNFEMYFVDIETADTYNVTPGYYLAIAFHLP